MKKIIIVFLSIISFSTFAGLHLSSKISSVKVFRQNAEISRVLMVDLTAGTQEIVFKDLSTYVIPSSLQVLINGKYTTLLSAKFEQNYLTPKLNSKEITDLINERDTKQGEFDWISDQIQILNGMEEILNKNQSLGGTTNGFNAAQVIELANSYRSKLTEIRKEKKALRDKQKKIKAEITKIQQQLSEKNALLNKPTGNIVLRVDSKSPEKVQIKCIYNVSNAGWNPLYDLRSDGIDKDVTLNYKANVWQKTNQDWDDVNIIISTGNPLQNNNRPVLTPLYANFFQQLRGRATHILNESSLSKSNMAYVNGANSVAFDFNTGLVVKQMNIEFEVANKQIIKADGKEYLMALKSYELPTEYVYHTVPKLNKGAFLLAKVSDWGQYNLIAGEANIFFDGAFIGKSNINPDVTADTLLISMGRDNGITIERKVIKKFTETNFIGSKKEETFGYEIIVLNKKTVPIDIEILDQIPVSQNEEIEVTLKEKGTAEYNKDFGKLLWKFTLQPGQSKKDKFIYSVKYPKKEQVTGLK